MHRKHCKFLAGNEESIHSVHVRSSCTDCQEVDRQGLATLSRANNPNYGCILAGSRFENLAPGLRSAHPFPLSGLPGDRVEKALMVMQKLILKMKLTKHKLYSICPHELKELERKIESNRCTIFLNRKLCPSHYDRFEGLDQCLDVIRQINNKI